MEMLRPSAVEAQAICDAGVIFDVKRNQPEVSTLGALRCAATFVRLGPVVPSVASARLRLITCDDLTGDQACALCVSLEGGPALGGHAPLEPAMRRSMPCHPVPCSDTHRPVMDG